MSKTCKNTEITRRYRDSKQKQGFVMIQIQRHVPIEMADQVRDELKAFMKKMLAKKYK